MIRFVLARFTTPFLFDGADAGSGGGSAAAAATPTATPASAPATSGATASPATPATTQAPATGAPGEGWVPSYRIRETREAAAREAASQFATREADYKRQLDEVNNKLRALVGVTPPADPRVAEVRDQFGNLYPGLAKLESQAAQLEALLERAGDLESQTNHYWTNYGRTVMDNLFKSAEETLGGPLADEGKRALHSAFVGFVQSSPELTARYAQDPSIVQDFWKVFSSTLIDPVRRTSAAGVAQRAGAVQSLPQDSPSGAVGTAAAAAPKLEGLDNRVEAAWRQYQATAKK